MFLNKSLGELMPSMHKAQGEIPSTKNKQKHFFYKSALW